MLVSIYIIIIRQKLPRGYFYLWLPMLLFIGITGGISRNEHAIQRSLIFITPILVGWATSSLRFEKEDISWVYRWIKVVAFFVLAIIFLKVVIFETAERGHLPGESIACVGLAWILFSYWRLTHDHLGLFVTILLLLVPFFAISRGPFVAGVLCVAFGLPFIGYWQFLLRIILLAGLLWVTVIAYQPLTEKMVYKGATLSDIFSSPGVLQTSGRLLAWEFMFNGILLRPFLGHGANASEEYLVGNTSDAFSHPHNDYLRLSYDYGIIGAVFFIGTFAVQFRRLLSKAQRTRGSVTRWEAYGAASLFFPFFLFMFVDNIVLYAAFFGNIHFLFIGMTESKRHCNKT